MADVRTLLLSERRSLNPWESESDSRSHVRELASRSPTELEALLVRVRRTRDFDDSVIWLKAAGLGLPRALYEGALLIYRDSAVLGWERCVQLARLLSWPPPRFRDFDLR